MSTGIIWWQPALWIGIAVACYWAYHRVKTERHYFYSALQSHWPEMKRFLVAKYFNWNWVINFNLSKWYLIACSLGNVG